MTPQKSERPAGTGRDANQQELHADFTADAKRFATLAARFALAGFSLLRNDVAPGLAPYCAVRWGWIRPLHNLDDAERLLAQIGGRHGL